LWYCSGDVAQSVILHRMHVIQRVTEHWFMQTFHENELQTRIVSVSISWYFERQIIRRIYGPVRQGMEWKTRNNEEIDNIIRKKI
jgi:hypothetical protein